MKILQPVYPGKKDCVKTNQQAGLSEPHYPLVMDKLPEDWTLMKSIPAREKTIASLRGRREQTPILVRQSYVLRHVELAKLIPQNEKGYLP